MTGYYSWAQSPAHDGGGGHDRIQELYAGALLAGLVAAVAWEATPRPYLAGWLALLGLIYGLRAMSRPRTPDPGSEAIVDTGGLDTGGRVLAGATWGAGAAGSLLLHGLSAPTLCAFAAAQAVTIITLGTHTGERRLCALYCAALVLPVLAAAAVVPAGTALVALVMTLVPLLALHFVRRALGYYACGWAAASDSSAVLATELGEAKAEIKRLRLEVKTTGDRHQALTEELDEAGSELSVLRTKADALSGVLQRVIPFDAETGLLNKDKFDTVLRREWARMLRQELPLSLVLVALDYFADYQEAYGRITYEATLRRIAEVLRRAGNRPGDISARLAQDKFALLFPEADQKYGGKIAEAVRVQLKQLGLPNAKIPNGGILTASLGVATIIPNSDLVAKDLLQHADAALCEARFQGGNKSVRYRTLNAIKLERWDPNSEGLLTPDGLQRKLALLGYQVHSRQSRPGEYQRDRRAPVDTVDAIIDGELKISLEGESRVLRPGDCLFIPKGLVTSAEAVGQKPVVWLEATRG